MDFQRPMTLSPTTDLMWHTYLGIAVCRDYSSYQRFMLVSESGAASTEFCFRAFAQRKRRQSETMTTNDAVTDTNFRIQHASLPLSPLPMHATNNLSTEDEGGPSSLLALLLPPPSSSDSRMCVPLEKVGYRRF